MKKKIFLIISLVLLLLLIFLGCITKNMPNNNNVIIIVSDALRSDMLGCYGGDVNTPNIDWLSEQGVLFERAYTTSPWTSPSSIAMFVGVYPNIYRAGFHGFFKKYEVPDSYLLLPEYLRAINYDVKKDTENGLSSCSNTMQGFDDIKSFDELTTLQKNNVEDITGIKNESEEYEKVYSFLSYILTVPENRPFLLHKWFLDPHGPYAPPEKYKQEIDVDISKLSKEKEFYVKLTGNIGWSEVAKKMSSNEKNYLISLYKKEVEFIDERIGFIIKALKFKKLLNNTFIIFTSDHGELLDEKQDGGEAWGHAENYSEKLVNVPLIIAGPGIAKGKRIKNVVSLLDLMPTIKDLLGVKFQDSSQGNSFGSLLSKNSIKFRTFSLLKDNVVYFIEANKRYDALIENEFKLVTWNEKKLSLYDLVNDPEERWSGSLGQETGIYKCGTVLVFMPQPVSVALC